MRHDGISFVSGSIEVHVHTSPQPNSHEYEVGIIVSTDNDLLPAIEAVAAVRGKEATPRICVVRYGQMPKALNYLDPIGRTLHAFHLTEADFAAVRDDTDYTMPAAQAAPAAHSD
jgi:hypothetical protein